MESVPPPTRASSSGTMGGTAGTSPASRHSEHVVYTPSEVKLAGTRRLSLIGGGEAPCKAEGRVAGGGPQARAKTATAKGPEIEPSDWVNRRSRYRTHGPGVKERLVG